MGISVRQGTKKPRARKADLGGHSAGRGRGYNSLDRDRKCLGPTDLVADREYKNSPGVKKFPSMDRGCIYAMMFLVALGFIPACHAPNSVTLSGNGPYYVGNDATFTCSSLSSDLPSSFIWRVNGIIVSNNNYSNVEIEHFSTRSHFVIKSLTARQDNTTVLCEATFPGGTIPSRTLTLHVHVGRRPVTTPQPPLGDITETTEGLFSTTPQQLNHTTEGESTTGTGDNYGWIVAVVVVAFALGVLRVVAVVIVGIYCWRCKSSTNCTHTSLSASNSFDDHDHKEGDVMEHLSNEVQTNTEPPAMSVQVSDGLCERMPRRSNERRFESESCIVTGLDPVCQDFTNQNGSECSLVVHGGDSDPEEHLNEHKDSTSVPCSSMLHRGDSSDPEEHLNQHKDSLSCSPVDCTDSEEHSNAASVPDAQFVIPSVDCSMKSIDEMEPSACLCYIKQQQKEEEMISD